MSANCVLSLNDKQVIINVSGELTIQNVAGLYDNFKSALDYNFNILLIHNEVSLIDLPYLQMLISFSNTLKSKSLDLIIEMKIDDTLSNLIDISGLQQYISIVRK